MENADEVIARALLPTPETLRGRKNLLLQSWRFIAINIRMVKMIFKGDH